MKNISVLSFILVLLLLLFGYLKGFYKNPMQKDAEAICKCKNQNASSQNEIEIAKCKDLEEKLLLDYLERNKYREFQSLVMDICKK